MGHRQIIGSRNKRWELSVEGAKALWDHFTVSLRKSLPLFWDLLEGGCKMGGNSASLGSPSWIMSLFYLPKLGTTKDQRGTVNCPRYTANV